MSAFTVFVFRTTKDITSDPRDVDLKQPLSWPLQMRLFQGSAMDKFQRFRECLAFHDSHAVSGMVTIEQLSQDETPELSVSLSTHKPKDADTKADVETFMWENMTGGQEPFPEGTKSSSEQGVYVCARSDGADAERVRLTVRLGWKREWPALDWTRAVEKQSGEGVQFRCRWFANPREDRASPVVFDAAKFVTTAEQVEAVMAAVRKRKEAPKNEETKEPLRKRAKVESRKGGKSKKA